MDLRLFHTGDNPKRTYKALDRFNSWTRRQPCRLLEWAGWYSTSIPLRLLGHYRLYQIHKRSFQRRSTDMSPVQGYILQYRHFHGIKFHLARFFSHFHAMWGYPDIVVEIQAVNRMLIYGQVAILHEFLTNADIDFEPAFRKALQQIHDPAFLNPIGVVKTPHPNVFVQVKQNYNTLTVVNEAVPVKEPISGKEKGVFSKKQVLIFFDMLAQSPKIERIDFRRPNKFDSIAPFFQALTGKGKETWVAELKDYQNKDLYTFHTPAEKKQLLTTLTNLAEISRAAGFRDICKLVDKKIGELEEQQ